MRDVVLVGQEGPFAEQLLAELGRDAATADDDRSLGSGAGPGTLRWQMHGDGPPAASVPFPDDLDCLVYLAGVRGARGLPDLADAEAWLRWCRDRPVPRLVLVSSAQVFEPSPRHPGLVAAMAGPPPAGTHPVAGRWRELERRAHAIVGDADATSRTSLTILRPTPVPVAGGGDYFSRLLEGRHAFTLPGHDPALQLLSMRELAVALDVAVRQRRGGVFHVAPQGAISLRSALRAAGVRRWPVPRLLQRPLRALAAPLGLTDPIAALDYIRYDWTISAERSRGKRLPPADGLELPAGDRAAALAAGAVREPAAEGDPFGMDVAYINALSRRSLRFLHDVYWRVELAGVEHVPREGPVVLVGVHRGFFPWDGMMILHALATRRGRYPRFLIHPGLLKFPFLFDLFRKMGGLPATQRNSDWVLRRSGALGVFPEGVEGAFRRYRDAYRLGRFGRGAFVKAALLRDAPIVPFVTVGSAEASPVLAKIHSRWWRRYAMWPCIPITPTLLPLPLPLPSKWHTRFLPPVELDLDDPTEAARDHAVVRRITRRIHADMQTELDAIRQRRPSVFAGNVFDRSPE